MSKSVIAEVVQSGRCVGCGLCEAATPPGKVSMVFSKDGFLRPSVKADLTKGEAALFRSYCPGWGLSHDRTAAEATMHRIWGPLVTVETGFAASARIRRQGSSGGVISALAAYLIESGQVDFVAQNAVDEADPLGNQVQASRTVDDVVRAAGSRYAPASPLRRIEEYLATGKRFAFVGKPCDVAALRALSRTDERVARQVPVMLSFMCAGVPSREGTVQVLRRMGVQADEVASFRYRGDGWPGMARAETRDGRAFEMDYNTSWGEVLNKHLQFRCKICPDGTGEFADVVCADAWYGKDGYPDFAERDGRSLVLARTAKGRALLDAALRDRAIQLEPLAVEEIAKMQPYQVARKQVVLARLVGAGLALGQWPRFRGLRLWRAAMGAGSSTLLRNALGTFKRARREAR